MLVACDGRNKEWCPYGSENCECDVYYPHELKEGEDRNISCTDINDDWQECYLEEVTVDKSFVGDTATLLIHEEPTESYELDFSKVKTVGDCVLLIKALTCGYSKGYEPTIRIYNTSPMYEQMKHLAKEGE